MRSVCLTLCPKYFPASRKALLMLYNVGPLGCFQISGIITDILMKSLFIFQSISLRKIHERVIPGSKSKNTLRPLVLTAKPIFRVGELVIASAQKSPLTCLHGGLFIFFLSE